MPSILDITKRQLTLSTNRIFQLPILILMPHSRCNCRCVMCDIWKANLDKKELSTDEIAPHLKAINQLGVRWVVLSGGEALLHTNLWTLCGLLKRLNIKISLLSAGLTLKKHAPQILEWCDEVIVSLDGSRLVHNSIRNVPNAFERLAEGVEAIKTLNPEFRVTGRCVLQKLNYKDLPNIIQTARDIGLDQISFLAADVSTEAFNRPDLWEAERVADIALSSSEIDEFDTILEKTIENYSRDFSSGFIAENPQKMRRLVRYYGATIQEGSYPEVRCNAPWVSAVIEADGIVRPCFFHAPLGNIHVTNFEQIINSKEAINFRKNLNVRDNPICVKCVCSLNLGPRADITK